MSRGVTCANSWFRSIPASSLGVRKGCPTTVSATRNHSTTTNPARSPPATPWTITACPGRLIFPTSRKRGLPTTWRHGQRVSTGSASPHFARDALRFTHHPQRIEPSDLLHVRFRPAAPQQLGDEVRESGDVFQTNRHLRDAVEVGADSHTV